MAPHRHPAGLDALNRIVALASGLSGGAAAVTFFEPEQLDLAATCGLDACRIPLGDTICNTARGRARGDLLEIPNTLADPRTAHLPVVTGPPFVHGYWGAPIFDPAGVHVGMLCVFAMRGRPQPRVGRGWLLALADLVGDALAQAEATRQAAEQARLLQLGEAIAGVGHWRLDAASGALSWSDEVYRIHGVTPETFDPQVDDALGFYPEPARKEVKALVQRALRTGEEFRFELEIVRRDGQRRHVVAKAVAERDEAGAVAALIGVFQDVTERTETLRRMDVSRQRYRLLAEQVTDVILVLSISGRTKFISPSVKAVWGYEPEEVIGQDTRRFIHKDDLARVELHFTKLALARDGRPGEPLEYRVRHASGAWRWMEAHARAVLEPDGSVREFIDTVRDITDRKAHESALAEARRQAEAASDAKSDFLANMTHELRTPLNSIIGFSHLLAQEHGLTPEQHRRVSLIEQAGRGLLAIVNDVLDLSKLEAGKVELAQRPFDLHRLLAEAVAMVEHQAAEKALKLVLEAPGEEPLLLLGDADRLRQVLLNLLSNAVKFTAQGEVRLIAEAAPAGAGVLLSLSVSDTGIGVAPERLAVLFDRFVQADGSISRRFGGTGLGLAISRQLMDAMGGRLEAMSTPGRGSRFTASVMLARAAAAPAAPETAEAEDTVNLSGRRILVAEDVRVNQELVRLMLSPFGCAVDVVENGAEALEALRAAPYDLVLMDMRMPVMDGLEATRRMRALGGRMRSTPVLALTANTEPEQVGRCLAAGMDGHIGKPFVTEELVSAVARWAGARRPDTAAA